MKLVEWIKSTATIGAMGATGFLLIADSAEDCSEAEAAEMTFHVTETTCGTPGGTLRVFRAAEQCGLSAKPSSSEQGLPDGSEGEFSITETDLAAAGWSIEGGVTPSGDDIAPGLCVGADGASEPLHRSCTGTREGSSIKLACRGSCGQGQPFQPEPKADCDAVLTW